MYRLTDYTNSKIKSLKGKYDCDMVADLSLYQLQEQFTQKWPILLKNLHSMLPIHNGGVLNTLRASVTDN